MASDTGKANKVRRTDVLESSIESREFDLETQKALEQIDSCQNDIDALNEKASEEILEVEKKYNKLRKPLYGKRNELVQRIPNFWVTAFVNHPQISMLIQEDEEECLHHLTKLEVEEFDDIKSGYRINFHFGSNPYFKNETITKEYKLSAMGDMQSESSQIQWKEGMDLVKKMDIERQKASAGKKRQHTIERSFFQWFNDNTDATADDVAEVIKDEMWPNPLQFFLAEEMDMTENGAGDSYNDDEDEIDESAEVIDEDELEGDADYDDDEGAEDEEVEGGAGDGDDE